LGSPAEPLPLSALDAHAVRAGRPDAAAGRRLRAAWLLLRRDAHLAGGRHVQPPAEGAVRGGTRGAQVRMHTEVIPALRLILVDQHAPACCHLALDTLATARCSACTMHAPCLARPPWPPPRRECVAACQPGATLRDLHHRSVQLLSAGLARLGMLPGRSASSIAAGAYRAFYPHSVCHWLGMDTHDCGTVSHDLPLEPGQRHDQRENLLANLLAPLLAVCAALRVPAAACCSAPTVSSQALTVASSASKLSLPPLRPGCRCGADDRAWAVHP
jgi:hypothetical protein